ncbi:MAG: glycoside hydrolase family 3 C-terminal domain-containing protein [Clostridia bacterium]|nr:glycoside hydrolase family 3 C-terminal domain-containing protein [Clostridia bacterium]
MNRLFSNTLWIILTVFFVILTAACIILTTAAYSSTNAINMIFNTSNYEKVDDPDAEATDFYMTGYDFERTGETMFEEDARAAEDAEREGAVLLWNKNSALPLAGNENVSILGRSSVDLVETGSGSGYVTGYDYQTGEAVSVSMKDALQSKGLSVNKTLWDFYSTGAGSSYTRTDPHTSCINWQTWYVNEVPYSAYSETVKNSFSTYNDLAIVVISRSGGENSDLHYNYEQSTDFTGLNDRGSAENTSAEGGYLGLTDEEEDLLTMATDGTFRKVVLLLNTANPLQMQDVEPYYDKIDSCMWVGQPGTTGINAVADLLVGRDPDGKMVSPSGRLSDTWAYDNNSAPSTVNDGNSIYGNTDLLPASIRNNSAFNRYMVYEEGIYVGYRYYETRYSDTVMGDGNATSTKGAKHSAGAWNYDEEVAFPFGYGLSYTSFTYSNFSVDQDGTDYVIFVTVENTGTYAGKEVVQAYLQKPYTDNDTYYEIEKSAIELAGYAKTSTLQPGDREEVQITVPQEYFKTYDANSSGTYVIEKGTYYLTVAQDVHAAVNNILSSQGENVGEAVLGGAEDTKATSFSGQNVYQTELSDDNSTYSVSAQTGAKIINRFSEGDINMYSGAGSNSVTYLSRADWDATYPAEAPEIDITSQMASDINFGNEPSALGYEMPEYGIFASGSTTGLPDVENGDLVAYQFIDAPLYPENEDPNELYNGITYGEWADMWDQLLNQMTYKEQSYMIVSSYNWIRGASSISLPESRQENGPVGITYGTETSWNSVPNDDGIKGNGTGVDDTGWTYIAYPCAGIISASFNNDIAEEIGSHMGEDMLYLGYNGVYAPGANLHRTPYGGRAYEYPSEDTLLTGLTDAYEVRGIQSKGCIAYVKHFALNDQETNRVNCGIWSNEQAVRELYLRAFEITFTEGKASGAMNSFTRTGTTWCGANYEMMTEVLRDEWGYEGIVVSDWVTTGSVMSTLDGVMAGTDTFDGNDNASSVDSDNDLTPYANNAAVAQAVRTAAKRVIYTVVHTNTMNGTSITMKIVPVTPWWQTALLAIDIILGILAVASAAMLIASVILNKRNGKSGGTPSLTSYGGTPDTSGTA